MRVLEATALPIVADADGIAVAQANAGGAVTLNGAGVATYPYMNGYTSSSRLEARLNPPRPVTITSVGDSSGVTVTVTGIDRAGKPYSETIAGPNATTSTTAGIFSAVYSITFSAAATGNVSAGWDDISYTKWIFSGNGEGDGGWKFRSYIEPSETATYDVEATSMPMNARSLHGPDSKLDAPTYVGGDLPDDLIALLSAQTGNVTSDNDTPWVAVRLKVTAQSGYVRLRVIPSRTV